MANDAVTCPGCGVEIGRVVAGPDGKGWLQVGVLRFAHVCAVCTCGRVFHYGVTRASRLERRMQVGMEALLSRIDGMGK